MNLENVEEVKALQANLRVVFESVQGKDVITFLEEICGWYDFKDTDTNVILIKQGKRQVLATIKTLLRLTPEQIVALKKENDNGES